MKFEMRWSSMKIRQKISILGMLVLGGVFAHGVVVADWVNRSNIVPWKTNNESKNGFSVGIDGEGNAELVFKLESGEVLASHLDYLGHWTNPILISASDEHVGYSTSAIDRRGHGVAIWQSGSKLESSFLINGRWSLPVEIKGERMGFMSYIAVRVDGNGNAIAVWFEESRGVIQAATSEFKSGFWSAPKTLTKQGDGNYLFDIAVNDFGDALVVWTTNIYSSGNAVRAVSYIKGAWSTPHTLADLGGEQELFDYEPLPQVDIDNNGNGVATWKGLRNDGIYGASFVNGAWSTAVRITSEGNANHPKVAVNKNTGDAVAIWRQEYEAQGEYRVEGSTLPFSGTTIGEWSLPVKISSKLDYFALPWLGIDSKGDALVVWRDAMHEVIKASYMKPFGGNWSHEVNISRGGSAFGPKIVVSPCGRAVAVWYRDSKIFESATWKSECASLSQ